MINSGLRSLFSTRCLARRGPVFNQSVRNYTKHECEGTGLRRLAGPFWPLTTPGFLQSYAIIGISFMIFLYPLDYKLFNVRKLKADLDSKVGS